MEPAVNTIFNSVKGKNKNILKNLFAGDDDSDGGDSDEDYSSGSETNDEERDENTGKVVEDAQYNEFTVQSVTVKIKERKQLGIAHQIWPAARFLCDFIASNPRAILDSAASSNGTLHIIELGAGLGLCGIFASLLFQSDFPSSKIVLTDLAEAIPGLNDNIELNKEEGNETLHFVESAVLSWGNEEELEIVMSKFPRGTKPLVLAADCVYWQSLFAPLFETINSLVQHHGCEVILCQIKRWKKEQKFFNMCKKAHLTVETVVEDIDMVPSENTGILEKQIYRIIRISKP